MSADSFTPQLERQWPLYAVFTVRHTDFVGTDPLTLGNIPAGAIVVKSFRDIEEAFDTSILAVDATGAFTIADSVANTTGRVDGSAPLLPAATVPVVLTRDTDTDVTGIVHYVVEYVIPGKQNEVQP